MESKTGGGNSGLAALTFKDRCLAYMQVKNQREFIFYELWNQDLWVEMLGVDQPIVALRWAAANGTLGLAKIRRTPMSRSRTIYDLQSATIEVIGQEKTCLYSGAAIVEIPKQLLIAGPGQDLVANHWPLVVKETIVDETFTPKSPPERDEHVASLVEKLTNIAVDLNTVAADLTALFPPKPGE